MKLRRNLLGPVLSRLKKKRHERRTKSKRTLNLPLTDDEVCTFENKRFVVEDEKRNDAEENDGRKKVKRMSAKEHQLHKYRINSTKSRPLDLDGYVDDDDEQEQDESSLKNCSIQNQADSTNIRRSQESNDKSQERQRVKSMRMITPRQSDGVSKSESTESNMSYPSDSGNRNEDSDKCDMSTEDDGEISFRGGNLGKAPNGSTIAEYGKSSQEIKENLPENEAPTNVERNARTRRVKAELVKYMSHREGSEKGFEVLLDDFRKFVAYCTIERVVDHSGRHTHSTTMMAKLEKDSKLSRRELDDSKKGAASDGIASSNNHTTQTSAKCVVECPSSTRLENRAEGNSKNRISILVGPSIDGEYIDAVSIASVPQRVTSVDSCYKSESKCVCKCCGHHLEESEIVTKESFSIDGYSRRQADLLKHNSEISRSAYTTSESKRKFDQNSIENVFLPDDQKTLPPLLVPLEDSSCSLPSTTTAASTKVAPETPINMLFSIFSSLSTKNDADSKNALAEVKENGGILQDKQEGANEGNRNGETERLEKLATQGEDIPVKQPLVVTVADSLCSDASESPLGTPITTFFSMFSSLSTKNKSDNQNAAIAVGENGETRQDIGDERRDEVSRKGEIERPREATTSSGKRMEAKLNIPYCARPPLPHTSTKPASRYVAYQIRREDSHFSLRSAPPRLSSDFPRDEAKGETSKQILSPSSITQRKDNNWDGRE